MATPSIEWIGIDKSSKTRSKNWYLVYGLILLTLGIASFLLQWFLGYWQFWSAFALAVLVVITVIISDRSVREVKYRLTKEDITINDKTYPLSDFKAFTVDRLDDTWALHLIHEKKLSFEFDVIIPSENAEKIVNVFSKLLPMEDSNRTVGDKLASILKL